VPCLVIARNILNPDFTELGTGYATERPAELSAGLRTTAPLNFECAHRQG